MAYNRPGLHSLVKSYPIPVSGDDILLFYHKFRFTILYRLIRACPKRGASSLFHTSIGTAAHIIHMEFRTHLPRLTRTLELPDGAPSVVSCVVRRIAGYGCWREEQVVSPNIFPIRYRHGRLGFLGISANSFDASLHLRFS